MRCKATTKAGKRCKAAALSGRAMCLFHSNMTTVKKKGRTYYRKGNVYMSERAMKDKYR